MAKINLLKNYPQITRKVEQRAHEKSVLDPQIARKFAKEYFDGERRWGYGGYLYDGRWQPIAKKLIKHYELSERENARILEIGCAKGFLLHDIKKVMPKCSVNGLDISEYARENAYGKTKEFIDIGSAHQLPYPDQEFDLVIAINTIHNLPKKQCIEALKEMKRVCKDSKMFISVDAWNNDVEKKRILDWNLTARTLLPVEEWEKALFEEAEYEGDYWFTCP